MKTLSVKNLQKNYETFSLKDVSFDIPKGYIMGFIGENGAGKTTTLKAMLNIISNDGGTVEVFGKNIIDHELEIKKDIAFVSGESFYQKSTLRDITSVFKNFYDNWDDQKYLDLLKSFSLDDKKRVDQLSQGMKVKYSIALALSHSAKLLILDEPTSGLDPVARDGLLAIFQDLVEDGEVSILFSTHITSDLDKCADYITFIQDGSIVESCSKDDLIDNHTLITGSTSSLESVKDKLISYKTNAFGFTGLMKSDVSLANADIKSAPPTLDDIMIYYAERGRK